MNKVAAAFLLSVIFTSCAPDAPTPISVPTGAGTEAVGKYEVHVVRCVDGTPKALQGAICGWLSAHPDLKFISATQPIAYQAGLATVIETVIVGYKSEDKKDMR